MEQKNQKEVGIVKKKKLFYWKSGKLTVKDMAIIAMLGAVAIVLGYFSITPVNFIKINFSQIPNEIISYLFGPIVGGAFGGILDIIKYSVSPTGPFFPGFTISGIVAGLIYGLVMYKKPVRLKRIVIANLITSLVVDILMNTYWLTLLFGSDFFVILPLRIIKTTVMLIVNTSLLYIVMTRLQKYLVREKEVSE